MGLFKALGRGIGKAASWLGDKIGSGRLQDWGDRLQEKCRETSRRTGSTREYDQNTSTVDETARIADILSEFSSGLSKQSREIESEAKAEVNSYFDQLYNAINGALGNVQVVRNLQTQKRIAVQSIDGSFNEVLSRRVSLSDRECLEILKLPKGSAKEIKMNSFAKKVIQEGLDKLSNKLKKTVSEICDSIKEELGSIVTQQQKQVEELMLHLDSLTEKYQDDTAGQEDALLPPAEKLATSELILELLRGA